MTENYLAKLYSHIEENLEQQRHISELMALDYRTTKDVNVWFALKLKKDKLSLQWSKLVDNYLIESDRYWNHERPAYLRQVALNYFGTAK